jgi:hypothetical protein
MTDADDRALARLAARAEGDAFFMASALAAYRAFAHLDEVQLAAWLRCSARSLARLALCRRPEGESAMFGDEVRQIADYVGADAGRLVQLLRTTENVAVMRATAPSALMAARDRRDEASTSQEPTSDDKRSEISDHDAPPSETPAPEASP